MSNNMKKNGQVKLLAVSRVINSNAINNGKLQSYKKIAIDKSMKEINKIEEDIKILNKI